MPKTATHNAILLRPPPGTRFSIHGQDVELQFPRGKEAEILTWLRWWIDTYVEPEIEAALRGPVDPHPEVTALKAKLQEEEANPGISQSEQKMAAMGMQPKPAAPHVPQFIPNMPRPFANMPMPGKRVVYGADGPMTEEQIRTLPDQPGPNGYLPVPPSVPVVSNDGSAETEQSDSTQQQTEAGEGYPPT